MKYKGQSIGKRPTLELIEIYIAEKGMECDPKSVYDYWEKKDWRTNKGKPIKNLELAVNVFNGIYVARKIGDAKRERNKNIIKVQLRANDIKKQSHQKKAYSEYKEQLKDKKWKAFRDFVFEVRGKKCEVCGSEKELQVHHTEYHKNAKAWEYTCNDVMVVCRECHKKIHDIKD